MSAKGLRAAALSSAVAAAVSAAAAAPPPAGAIVAGAIDSRFGSCGQATGLVPRDVARRQFSYGAGAALAVQPDGRIVAAGPAARGMGATRFNAGGGVDASFGGDGVAFVPVDSGDRFAQTEVTSVAVQPDGKVVAAGFMRTQAGSSPASPLVERVVIARFSPTGEPDPSFSGDGLVVEAPAGATSGSAEAIAPAAGGALVVAGEVDDRFAVIRYRDDGSLDPGFGEGGVARVATPTRPAGHAYAVAVRPDGRIVAAGETRREDFASQAFTVARLTAGGAPDPSFAGTGAVTETFDEQSFARELVLLGDGRLYAVGTAVDRWGDDEGGGTTRRAAIVRYLENGERDDGFAGDGSVLDALGRGLYAEVLPQAAAVDPEGRLVISAGTVVRYTPAGERDRSFGLDGILQLAEGGGVSLAALPDGALLLGGGNARQGTRPSGFEWGPAVIRLAGSGQALESVKGQPAACFLRVRNPSLTHLLRRGRTARYGRLLVGAFLTQPSHASGGVAATATAGGRTFELGFASFALRYAGGAAFEIRLSRGAYDRLRRARSARIAVTLRLTDPDTAPVSATRTLRR